MAEDLENGLRKLGLDEKQAKVYLAALELGPSPVQKIAQRAGIPRATTYLVLDDLKNIGLVTTFEQGKKTNFVAEAPRQLSDLVERNEKTLEEQRELVKTVIPELDKLGQFKQSIRPVVRYYEGSTAVRSFVKDLLSQKTGGEVLNFLHLDKAEKTLASANYPIEKVREQRLKLKINSRVIYTSSKGPQKNANTPLRKAKYLVEKDLPFDADISIRDNKVFFIPYGTTLRGIVIEDEAIAQAMKIIFNLTWDLLPD